MDSPNLHFRKSTDVACTYKSPLFQILADMEINTPTPITVFMTTQYLIITYGQSNQNQMLAMPFQFGEKPYDFVSLEKMSL
jgi:hypothetical protein